MRVYPTGVRFLSWHSRKKNAAKVSNRRRILEGTMVIHGVRATYRIVRSADAKGFRAEVKIGANGCCMCVGGADKVFANETSTRRAVQEGITVGFMKQVAGGGAL